MRKFYFVVLLFITQTFLLLPTNAEAFCKPSLCDCSPDADTCLKLKAQPGSRPFCEHESPYSRVESNTLQTLSNCICRSGFVWSPSLSMCIVKGWLQFSSDKDCPQNCTACFKNGFCSGCVEGNFLDSNYHCSQAINQAQRNLFNSSSHDKCLRRAEDGKCLVCSDGQLLNDASVCIASKLCDPATSFEDTIFCRGIKLILIYISKLYLDYPQFQLYANKDSYELSEGAQEIEVAAVLKNPVPFLEEDFVLIWVVEMFSKDGHNVSLHLNQSNSRHDFRDLPASITIESKTLTISGFQSLYQKFNLSHFTIKIQPLCNEDHNVICKRLENGLRWSSLPMWPTQRSFGGSLSLNVTAASTGSDVEIEVEHWSDQSSYLRYQFFIDVSLILVKL